ncbi:MFS transporter, partial [Streptomyces wadayamensis]
FGALLLFGGRLVAILGRRPVYLAALLVFAAASLVGALADHTALLVATRFVKGFCAALTAPTGLAIIASAFPEGPARSRALSVYSLFGASGFSVGLLLSGAL